MDFIDYTVFYGIVRTLYRHRRGNHEATQNDEYFVDFTQA